MTYLELINNFWEKDLEHNFSANETALYFHLLNVCNRLTWKNPMGQSNAMMAAKFGWGRTSFDTAKKKLKDAGLIDFKSGDGRGNVYQYFIIGLPVRKVHKKDAQKDTLSDHLSEQLPCTFPNTNPTTSIEVDKEEEIVTPIIPEIESLSNQEKESPPVAPPPPPRKATLDLSFVAAGFEKPFSEWLAYKAAKKSGYKNELSIRKCYTRLLNLSQGNPDTAQQIVDYSIANNYSGIFELKNYENRKSGSNSPADRERTMQRSAAGYERGLEERERRLRNQ